jgi:hypothetical protein
MCLYGLLSSKFEIGNIQLAHRYYDIQSDVYSSLKEIELHKVLKHYEKKKANAINQK